MTPSELEQELEKEHKRIHGKLFPPKTIRAKIFLRIVTQEEIDKSIPNLVSSYYFNDDCIMICVTESDLQDDIRIRGCPIAQFDPIWKRDILHETLHEYQYKCVNKPSEEGMNLMRKDKYKFTANGHDSNFYTAITHCAKKLGFSNEEFLKMI